MPAILKDAWGGGWKHVYKVNNVDELIQAYDQTGTLCMIVQEFIEWDQYVRCVCVGQDNILPIRYDPGERRYHVDHAHLSPELGDRVVSEAITLNRALGYDMNSVEFAIRDGVPYALDFMNPAPDMDINSLTPIDVRILTSCNVDPMEAVRSGSLRSDLFYRLSVYTLRVPPLRERREDIPVLMHAFARQTAESMGTRAPEFAPDVLQAFTDYDWPGNVRELRNAVQSTVGLCPGDRTITQDDLPDFVRQSLSKSAPASSTQLTLEEAVSETERAIITEALRRHNGRVSDAAKELGLTRQSLHYRMAKHGIK